MLPHIIRHLASFKEPANWAPVGPHGFLEKALIGKNELSDWIVFLISTLILLTRVKVVIGGF